MTHFDLAETASRVERVRADQIRALYRNAPVGVVATLFAGVVLVLLLLHYGDVSRTAMLIWLGVMIVQTTARVLLSVLYHRRAPTPQAWRAWARAFCVGTLVGGITWGVGSLWMMDPGHFDRQLLVILVICALVYGALSSFGSYLPAFYAFFLPALVPVTVWAAFQPDVEHTAFAALSALWIPTIAWMARRYNRDTVESHTLRYENLDLLEEARRLREGAEQANIAKSRFLASASHDLRQPVHALGLFVGALRAHDMNPPALRLLNHIDSSVNALDSLFSAMLDISRLDAGVIQVNLRSFAIQPLLERIWQDNRAEAIEKGLQLSLAPCTALVRSDPVLLERILRNVVSNAVRYTHKGRIVIGCRRGAALSIQVWDTGAGIAEDYREQIFQEFFRSPIRDATAARGWAWGWRSYAA